MQIDVKTAARLLGVSEKTIYNWAGNGDLPCHRVHQQYRFNPAEILEWATGRGMPVSPDIFSTEAEPQALLPGLEQAIVAGGIHDARSAAMIAVLAVPLAQSASQSPA